MSRRTAVIAAALLALLCVRLPAWHRAASAADAPMPQAIVPGEAANAWVSVHIEWQLGPAPRRWLDALLELEGELRTWL